MTKMGKNWHLQNLFSDILKAKIDKKYSEVLIKGLTLDSRKVESGFLFAALKGSNADGIRFVDSAIDAGAVAILCDKDAQIKAPKDTCLIKSDNTRKLFSLIAAKFYATQPDVIAAVTGTNGKTSTVHFCQEIWKHMGLHAASIGTIGIEDSEGKFDYDRSDFLTTPDPVKLHKIISQLTAKGTTNLAMEASSHGLDQYRLHGINVKIGAFTNLSRDHLDYHGDFENYLNAKIRLFNEIMQEGSVAVLNSDVPEYDKLLLICEKRKHTIISYGKYDKHKKNNDIEIFDIVPTSQGQQVSFEILGKVYNVNTPLIGEFQVYNLLCALGVVMASGCNLDDAVDALDKVSCVPGRMQRVTKIASKFAIFVDYSHTPDALEKALAVLKPHTKGKLWVVFGCGGDRDKGKRPQMGRVAEQLADKIIITDDNPRSENPDAIRKEILVALSGKNVEEIGDRGQAIKHAVSKLEDGDILLVAGKGHEKTQTIGDQVLPFDDVKVVRDSL